MSGLSGRLPRGQILLSLVERSQPPRKVEKEWERIKEVYDRHARRFRRVYKRQAWPEVLRRIKAGEVDEALLQAIAISLMTEWPEKRLKGVEEFAHAFYMNTLYGYELGAQAQYRALGGKGRFRLRDPKERRFLKISTRAQAEFAVLQTLDSKLFMWMTRGVLQGFSPDDAPLNYGYLVDVNHHVTVLGGYSHGRSRVVDRSLKGGEMWKVWRHAGIDEKRRDHHQAVEGMKLAYNEFFPVGPNGVRYPHDWENAGCEEWCNCHCYIEYIPGKDAQVEPWDGRGA